MMKKLLSLFVAAVVATAVSAQSFKTAPAFSLQKNPVCQLDKQQKKSPAKVMAATGQLIMGTYATDEVATSNAGLGIPNYPGTIGAASYIPIDVVKSFDGGKVVKMRVGLANAAAVTRVFILPVTDSGVGAPILSQDVNANAAGWTEFDIENPVTLDFTGVSAILMGFDYTQKSTQANESYPLSMVNVGELQNVYMYGNLVRAKVGTTSAPAMATSVFRLSSRATTLLRLISSSTSSPFPHSSVAMSWLSS